MNWIRSIMVVYSIVVIPFAIRLTSQRERLWVRYMGWSAIVAAVTIWVLAIDYLWRGS